MTTLRLEHAMWPRSRRARTVDRDPIGREQLGVRAHRVFRPLDDPNYVAVDLEFDSPAEAERCKVALGELWRSKQAAPALRGAPQVRIVETVESVQY